MCADVTVKVQGITVRVMFALTIARLVIMVVLVWPWRKPVIHVYARKITVANDATYLPLLLRRLLPQQYRIDVGAYTA